MKSCFALWSAGLDSTYMILRLLEKNYSVRAGYVDIKNNYRKTKMELSAIKSLYPQIKAKFPHFQYDGIIYEGQSYLTDYRNLKYRQVPYFLHALLTAPETDFRCLGYVYGDSSIKNIENIRQIYNAHNLICIKPLPKLSFPLKKITKLQILNDMRNRYFDIYANCVWCASPQEKDFSSCNKCAPCLRRSRELVEFYSSDYVP